MDTIIQKAAKGNRAAMTQLYENNVSAVYCMSNALLRGSEQAVPATNWGIKSALQAAEKGTVQTEEEFSLFAMKQAAGYCKKEVVKKDSRAFKLPPKKDFHISHINEQAIDPKTADVENYIQCLPAIQRFTFVLRHLCDMDDLQIGKVIGLDSGTIAFIKEAETDNLAKIYRAAKNAGSRCKAPTKELVKTGFVQLRDNTELPDAVSKYIENYIDSIAAPIEAAAKNKSKKFGIIAAAVLVCVVIFIAVFAGSGNENVTTSDDDDFYETGSNDSDTTTSELDPSLIYYADIELKDYGTITVQLDQKAAPITVENFVNLAESGFYDGLTFHRIIEGFMMQGGCPEGTGYGGSDEEIFGEFSENGYDNPLSHTRGAISMARSDAYDSASSQFFIVHEDSIESLDGKYAAFGYVIEGMDVVDAVCETAEPTDGNGSIAAEDQPVITSITIRTEAAETEDTNNTDVTESGTVTE